jgi:hypothetical protein
MEFTLHISCNNDAFCCLNGTHEVARILRDLSARLAEEGDEWAGDIEVLVDNRTASGPRADSIGGTVADYNGNTVGRFAWLLDENE